MSDIIKTAKRELAEHGAGDGDPCDCEWCDAMRYILSTAEIVRCATVQADKELTRSAYDAACYATDTAVWEALETAAIRSRATGAPGE